MRFASIIAKNVYSQIFEKPAKSFRNLWYLFSICFKNLQKRLKDVARFFNIYFRFFRKKNVLILVCWIWGETANGYAIRGFSENLLIYTAVNIYVFGHYSYYLTSTKTFLINLKLENCAYHCKTVTNITTWFHPSFCRKVDNDSSLFIAIRNHLFK